MEYVRVTNVLWGYGKWCDIHTKCSVNTDTQQKLAKPRFAFSASQFNETVKEMLTCEVSIICTYCVFVHGVLCVFVFVCFLVCVTLKRGLVW